MTSTSATNHFLDAFEKSKNKFLKAGRENWRELSHQLFPQRSSINEETDYVYSILYIIGLILLALLIIFIQGFFVKTLWNFVLPRATDDKIKRLNWLSAISLLILMRILFF